MFRENVNYIMAVNKTNQAEIAKKLNVMKQSLSRKLGENRWKLEDLKELYSYIYGKNMNVCFIDRETGGMIVTEDLNLLLQKNRISKVSLTKVLNVRRVRIYNKFSKHEWFKDDIIRVANAAGYDFAFCDDNREIVYKFTADDMMDPRMVLGTEVSDK